QSPAGTAEKIPFTGHSIAISRPFGTRLPGWPNPALKRWLLPFVPPGQRPLPADIAGSTSNPSGAGVSPASSGHSSGAGVSPASGRSRAELPLSPDLFQPTAPLLCVSSRLPLSQSRAKNTNAVNKNYENSGFSCGRFGFPGPGQGVRGAARQSPRTALVR